MNLIAQILDTARWAPSGDNTQPWRFELVNDRHFVVHGFDTREHCVYDLDGRASQTALGGLLENIAIAAAEFGFRAECRLRPEAPETRPTFDVFLHADSSVPRSLLHPYIPVRAVQRRRLSPKPLTAGEKAQLEQAALPGHRILWLDGRRNRFRMAGLLSRNAEIRLTIPEAYQVHKAIIEWNSRFSEDRIPDRAIGLDPLALRLMRWTLGSWRRVHFFGTYLAGTVVPRLELDWLPGIFCGAHLVLVADDKPATIDDYLAAGRAMQRVWLTAAKLGLQMQPEMTPLIFFRYVREGRAFTKVAKATATAGRLAGDFAALVGDEASGRAVFMGRVGHGRGAASRSLRLPLEKLMHGT
jgi:hypothetical protein